MKVSELVKELQKYPEDYAVMIGYQDIENGDTVQDVDGVREENLKILGEKLPGVVIFDINYRGAR